MYVESVKCKNIPVNYNLQLYQSYINKTPIHQLASVLLLLLQRTILPQYQDQVYITFVMFIDEVKAVRAAAAQNDKTGSFLDSFLSSPKSP